MPFGSGTTAQNFDPQRVLLEKILTAVNAGGGAGAGGMYSGHGAPAIVPAQTVALYIDLDSDTLYWWYSAAWHP